MMAQSARFEELFDEWNNETDLSMVDLGDDIASSNPNSPILSRVDQRAEESDTTLLQRHKSNAEVSISSVPSYPATPRDESSTRRLLKQNSFAASSNSNLDSIGKDSVQGEPRRRHVFGANVRRLLPRRSTQSTFDGKFAHGKPGLWRRQMLVDRSLRSMAAFTTICAVIMLIIVLAYVKDFANRINKNTTSVGGRQGESCGTAEGRDIAAHLFINIAATMVLGCSNTYQQIVTALKVGEVRWVLSKKGDARVGTNSPFNINDKPTGKLQAWSAWLLLIGTSIPIHFLANSIVGPSFYINTPTSISYLNSTTKMYSFRGDSGCWTAFRAGTYQLPRYASQIAEAYNRDVIGNSTTFSDVEVYVGTNCTHLINTTDVETALNERTDDGVSAPEYWQYEVENCRLNSDVVCKLSNPQPQQCRMNVRMQAAMILMGCLFIKAVYMIMQNVRDRYRTKEHLLTFGDVIMASVIDPELKIRNECLLNAGDGWRTKVSHRCHKHCKDPKPSATGDSIGHCQTCKKYNDVDRAAELAHPSIAIKYKRSLLSNMGSNAITQMLILVFTSAAMLGVSIMLVVAMVVYASNWHLNCDDPRQSQRQGYACSKGLSHAMKLQFGTWGGFTSSATVASFSADSLGSEFMAFAISNGAQFLYSLLYLLLIYNITLVSMESEWGKWETTRKRPRCTIVSGRLFEQSYFLQLPSRILVPVMIYSALMHWLLGEAISTVETIYTDPMHGVEHSIYFVTYAAYPIFISTVLMIAMTVVCWWAFTYRREGFIPQMFGSIRACCASTTELEDFSHDGIQWGDLGKGETFRHAGFSADEPGEIIPAELYCGKE